MHNQQVITSNLPVTCSLACKLSNSVVHHTEIPISIKRDPTHIIVLVVEATILGLNIGSRSY